MVQITNCYCKTTKDLAEDCQGFNTVDILIRNVDKSDEGSLTVACVWVCISDKTKLDKISHFIVDLRAK